MRIVQEKGAPIVFLLHVIDGVIDELEVFTADSSMLDVKKIKFGNVEYIIDETVK